MQEYSILQTKPSSDYALLDSGEGEKLERYGDIVVARPDPQALWPKRLDEAVWKKADAFFKRDSTPTSPNLSSGRRGSEWTITAKVPKTWPIELGGLKFWIKLSAFKHTGLFPEQLSNWEWIKNVILSKAKDPSRDKRDSSVPQNDNNKVKVLNLF